MNAEPHARTGALPAQAKALLSGQRDRIANAANLSALLFMELEDINWAGFYFLRDGQLVLGPFQGRPACATIPLGRGVCGTAASSLVAQRVADVHQFDGHIACDANSKSELVVPLVLEGKLLGVLDIDSPIPGRFSEQDQRLIEAIAGIYLDSID